MRHSASVFWQTAAPSSDVNLAVPLLLAAGLGLVVGLIAQSRGRSFIGWWFFGFMFFIVAIILVLVLPRRGRQARIGPSDWRPALPPQAVPPPPAPASPASAPPMPPPPPDTVPPAN